MPGQPAQNAYTEMHDLAKLRLQSKHNQTDAMRDVAKQFESLFLKMMLKSMREASFGNPLFDDSKTELYRDMADNQLALNLANGKGIGLADSLMKQLSRYTNHSNETADTKSSVDLVSQISKVPQVPQTADTASIDAEKKLNSFQGALSLVTLKQAIPGSEQQIFTSVMDQNKVAVLKGKTMPVSFTTPEHFVRNMLPMAEKAAAELGVSPQVLIAQAALETGWGKAVNKFKDGSSSYNLFNIKADQRWSGETVSKSTLEYQAGTAKREIANFRAYDNYADSFNDYVQFLKSNPRYQQALASSAKSEEFVSELQQAGYATDPDYANKILDILKRDPLQRSETKPTETNHG